MKMNTLYRYFLIAILTAFSAISTYCIAADDDDTEERVAEAEDTRPIISVDDRKFQNKTNDKNLNFSSLAERITHVVTQSGLFQVMNREDLSNVLDAKEEDFVIFGEETELKLKKQACWIRLTVIQYDVREKDHYDIYTKRTIRRMDGEVEFIASIVDAKTALVLKSVNCKGSFSDSLEADIGETVKGNIRETVLQNSVAKAARELIAYLTEFSSYTVMDDEAAGGVVLVDIPGTFVDVGECLLVSKPTKKRWHPRRKKWIGADILVAEIQIVRRDNDFCYAKVVRRLKNEKISTGWHVKFMPTTALQQPIPQPKPQEPPKPQPGPF